jgi:hypothetical protein
MKVKFNFMLRPRDYGGNATSCPKPRGTRRPVRLTRASYAFFHQMKMPDRTCPATSRLITRAMIRVGVPKMSPK